MDQEYEIFDDTNVVKFFEQQNYEEKENEGLFDMQLASLLMSEGKIDDALRVIENIDVDYDEKNIT